MLLYYLSLLSETDTDNKDRSGFNQIAWVNFSTAIIIAILDFTIQPY